MTSREILSLSEASSLQPSMQLSFQVPKFIGVTSSLSTSSVKLASVAASVAIPLVKEPTLFTERAPCSGREVSAGCVSLHHTAVLFVLTFLNVLPRPSWGQSGYFTQPLRNRASHSRPSELTRERDRGLRPRAAPSSCRSTNSDESPRGTKRSML